MFVVCAVAGQLQRNQPRPFSRWWLLSANYPLHDGVVPRPRRRAAAAGSFTGIETPSTVAFLARRAAVVHRRRPVPTSTTVAEQQRSSRTCYKTNDWTHDTTLRVRNNIHILFQLTHTRHSSFLFSLLWPSIIPLLFHFGLKNLQYHKPFPLVFADSNYSNNQGRIQDFRGGVRTRREASISVGVQSTLGGKTFLTENICMKKLQNVRILHDICPKINKIPEFYMIYARKNNKMP